MAERFCFARIFANIRAWSFTSAAGLILLLAGCSTARPVRSERKGLFDQLAFPTASREPSWRKAERVPAGKGLSKASLHWPLKKVTITSPFGARGDGFHEGIDLRAKTGTSVFAAQAGKVIYADRRIRGYGRMVVIQHPGGYATVYAHNSKVLVRKGQTVKQGQKIAISGSSGHATGPHLHFEIRYGVSAIDPLQVMPRASVAESGAQLVAGNAIASHE